MRDIDILKEALTRLGATKVAHQEGTLLNHLENTHCILVELGCPKHVCLAGLFHGAYGTQALHSEKIESISEGRRDEVRDLIGEKAERLVFTFSVMSYDSLGKSFRSVLKPNGQPVLRDRRTGELLSTTRNEFEDLLYLKLADMLAHVPTRNTQTQLDLPSEYGSFWQVVAEHLGSNAAMTWNRIIGESLWIQLDK